VLLSPLLDAPLIAGPLPTALSVVGALGGAVLMVRHARRWWLRQVPLAALGGAGVAALSGLLVAILRPFPDLLPLRVLGWIAVFAGAAVLAWGYRRAGWGRRAVAVCALVAVLGTCVMKVNAFYGYRPTIATALGLPAGDQIDFAALPRSRPFLAGRSGRALADTWHGPGDMPGGGRVARVALPGLRSHFPARAAWLYLPPAYLASPRARLPVLVMIPGQPGGPRDWLLAGRLAEVMDAFAAAHGGLAPVVVVPDVTGSDLGNSLCLDSRLGSAETYLAVDVPAWAAANLQVDTSRLAIGGFSFGGTCALQLALRRPAVYPTFLDISGQAQPSLGDQAGTVAAAFGGDTAAYQRVDPLDELRTNRYPGSAGLLVVGRADDVYRPQAEQVAAAARAAGMEITLDEVPGEHSWAIASDALAAALPWIAGRTGLLDPVRP
jgi:S-formylglutathione hydrolase FrmB